MITRGTTVGVLLLVRAPSAPPFRDDETQAAVDLAGRAAAGLADSLALMRHRSVTEALQPPRRAVTQVAHGPLEIAGRCLPATGCDAGGDWYDIIPLPGDRTGLIVGDVMGHGPLAATVMTRLSAAAYALADLDLPPAEVVRQLNRTALALPQDTLVTCAYAVIDPARQSCAITAAGHLPPDPGPARRHHPGPRPPGRPVARGHPRQLRGGQDQAPAGNHPRPVQRRPGGNPHPSLRPRHPGAALRPGPAAPGPRLHLRGTGRLTRGDPRRRHHDRPREDLVRDRFAATWKLACRALSGSSSSSLPR